MTAAIPFDSRVYPTARWPSEVQALLETPGPLREVDPSPSGEAGVGLVLRRVPPRGVSHREARGGERRGGRGAAARSPTAPELVVLPSLLIHCIQDEPPDFEPPTMSNPFLKQVFNKDKTFRPKRKFEPGTQRFELHKRAQASLNAGLDLRLAVQLPPGEDLNDWVAVHVVDFFNRVNLVYGTVSDGCTEQSCPVMSGGPKYEYRWQDEREFRKPTALPAPKYMDLLMDWVEAQINNEDLFPTNVGTPFPKNFLQVVKKILSRLFRVFVHVYIHHFDRIAQMGSEAHVNTCYKHFYYFVREFSLIDTKELEPLKEMTTRMCH
ncbi:MOB kinase activator 3A [Tenrec ecaudatus]|uniref:MOB kinase activator 3A n=1 Tax=Tenrec ecaudatus TaxID=94439 RepID=UPI003F5A90D6